ncbi:antirestriction protein, partial [Escherichia coli]
SISDDDLCAWCTRLLYRPGELSLCRLSTGNGIWPSVCDRNGYAYGCPEFQQNIIHP